MHLEAYDGSTQEWVVLRRLLCALRCCHTYGTGPENGRRRIKKRLDKNQIGFYFSYESFLASRFSSLLLEKA